MGTFVQHIIKQHKPDKRIRASLRKIQNEYLLTPEEKWAVHTWLRERSLPASDKRTTALIDSLNIFN